MKMKSFAIATGILGFLFSGTVTLAACPTKGVKELTGAGATFPYPLYSKMFAEYDKACGVKVNYQSIGSGGGIRQLQELTVDFGASDGIMDDKQKAETKNGAVLHIPTVAGAEAIVYNLPGIQRAQLKLTPDLLADIYLKKIKTWNDARIKAINPGLNLPSTDIAVIHRSDGSGTTFIFTNYLAKVSPEWKDKVSEGTSVQWPAGLGGKGNEGVAALTSRTAGAIGYVEYAYALQNKMIHTKLVNHDGAPLEPGIKVFQADAAHANWKSAAGFYLILTDQPGKETWPLPGATLILMHKKQEHP